MNQPPVITLKTPAAGREHKASILTAGGRPSKGTKKDKRLKGNKGGKSK